MKNLINLEFLKLKKTIIWSYILFVLIAVVSLLSVVKGYSYYYNIEIWDQSYEVILLFFPIFCTVPVSWLLYYEKKDNFIDYSLIRISRKKYTISKIIVHSSFAFIVTFSMSIVGALITLYIIPEVSISPSYMEDFRRNMLDENGEYKIIWRYFLYEKTVVFVFILGFFRGIISISFVLTSFICANYIKNIFIVALAPFMYYFIENVILSNLGLPMYRLSFLIGNISSGYGITNLNATPKSLLSIYIAFNLIILLLWRTLHLISKKTNNKLMY